MLSLLPVCASRFFLTLFTNDYALSCSPSFSPFWRLPLKTFSGSKPQLCGPRRPSFYPQKVPLRPNHQGAQVSGQVKFSFFFFFFFFFMGLEKLSPRCCMAVPFALSPEDSTRRFLDFLQPFLNGQQSVKSVRNQSLSNHRSAFGQRSGTFFLSTIAPSRRWARLLPPSFILFEDCTELDTGPS